MPIKCTRDIYNIGRNGPREKKKFAADAKFSLDKKRFHKVKSKANKQVNKRQSKSTKKTFAPCGQCIL